METPGMSPKLSLQEVVEHLAVALPAARWEYDDEADELEIVLPAGAGREGRAILIDEGFYLRLDPETNEPLTIIIPAVSVWLGQQVAGLVEAPHPSAPPQSWQDGSHGALALSLARTVRASGALAAAVS
jgi:hypothetical protein